MAVLFAFIAATVFLIGLYQWAQGGASLWRIFTLRRHEKDLTRAEKVDAEREVKQLEQTADRTISASFRIIAVLAVFLWVFLGVTMLLELFGINWISYVSTQAKTYWSNPAVTSTTPNLNQSRNDTLRNMGNNLRR